MKKKISVFMAVVMTAVTLAACGGKFTCDLCGQEKSGKAYTTKILGEKITYCKDCKETLESLGSLFN